MITKEQQAGELYIAGAKAVRNGGHELQTLAMHMIFMVNGTAGIKGPLWPVRELPDGRVIQLDRFIDYLLKPAREGLELPSLHFLKQALEATPEDGDEALGMVRAELAKEHVDFDAQAKRDEMKLHGERPAQPVKGTNQYTGSDNVRPSQHGNTAAYLAARLKRDYPEISAQLGDGKFKSVRAAAIEAGIITPLTPLDRLRKDWKAATEDERKIFLDEVSTKE